MAGTSTEIGKRVRNRTARDSSQQWTVFSGLKDFSQKLFGDRRRELPIVRSNSEEVGK